MLPEHRTNAHRLATLSCTTYGWESRLDLEPTPEPLFSSSSPCRPSSLFLFLFCCCSNSSWIFFLCCPKGTCLPSPVWRFFLTQAPSLQQPTLCIPPSVFPFCPSALPIVTHTHMSPYSQLHLTLGTRMGRTCTTPPFQCCSNTVLGTRGLVLSRGSGLATLLNKDPEDMAAQGHYTGDVLFLSFPSLGSSVGLGQPAFGGPAY